MKTKYNKIANKGKRIITNDRKPINLKKVIENNIPDYKAKYKSATNIAIHYINAYDKSRYKNYNYKVYIAILTFLFIFTFILLIVTYIKH